MNVESKKGWTAFMFDWFRRWRYGGKTGLNQASNSVRMLVDVALPICIGYIVIRLFVPYELVDLLTIIMFICWIAYVVLLIAKRKSDAASYIPFPQAHWYFLDGQQLTWDLLVPPNGWEEIAKYPDGSVLLRVHFKDKMEYDDPDRPYPDIFDRALWKVPAEFTKAFERSGFGEFFFSDVFVEHPACENISVYVVGWKTERIREPVCLIGACSYAYRRTLEKMGKQLYESSIADADLFFAFYQDTRKRAERLEEHNAYLEEVIAETNKEKPQDLQKLIKSGMNRNRERVLSIMDTGESVWSRIKNVKTLAIAAIIIVLILIASHIWLGFP